MLDLLLPIYLQQRLQKEETMSARGRFGGRGGRSPGRGGRGGGRFGRGRDEGPPDEIVGKSTLGSVD